MSWLPNAICGIPSAIRETNSVIFPTSHYVQYRPTGYDQGIDVCARLSTVELNTREHGTVSKLGRFLLENFGIKEREGYTIDLKFTRVPLTDEKVPLCEFLVNTPLNRLILEPQVSFVFYYKSKEP